MYTQNYKIADKVFGVTSIHERVHKYCADYQTEEPAEYRFEIAQKDIDFETLRELKCAEREGRPPLNSPDDYRELLAVYRKIAEKCPEWDRILFHGSCISVDGQGFLFTAKSGTGKSTHTRLWRELLGEKAVMVNDDKPILHVSESGVTVFGTPYNGKHRLGCNTSVPLTALCILERAAENSIVRITKDEAYAMLLQQVYRPQSSESLRRTLMLIDRLAANTALYRLGCNMDISAAETAYNAMKGT